MSELRLYIGLRGFDCTPEHITEILQIEPSSTGLRGTPVKPGRPPLKRNLWQLESGINKNDLDIEHHLDALWTKVGNKVSQFQALPPMPGKWLECVVYGTDGFPSVYLRPKDISLIHQLELAFDVDIYNI